MLVVVAMVVVAVVVVIGVGGCGNDCGDDGGSSGGNGEEGSWKELLDLLAVLAQRLRHCRFSSRLCSMTSPRRSGTDVQSLALTYGRLHFVGSPLFLWLLFCTAG